MGAVKLSVAVSSAVSNETAGSAATPDSVTWVKFRSAAFSSIRDVCSCTSMSILTDPVRVFAEASGAIAKS